MIDKPLAQCINLNKYYFQRNKYVHVLKDINFSLYEREKVVIVGSSGSGKSTFLHLLGGIDQPTSGTVLFEGHSIHQLSSEKISLIRNQKIGLIYQSHFLLKDFSILENVAIPQMIRGTKATLAREKAKDMLNRVGLIGKSKCFPNELSFGENQRVSIARALINEPKLVLADEPTGNLDKSNSINTLNLLLEFHETKNISIVLITHDLSLIKYFERKLEIIDGKLKKQGSLLRDE